MALIDDVSIVFTSLLDIIQQGYSYFYFQASGLIGETYLQTLLFTIGMFVYAIFIWYFYKSLSKRDLIKLDMEKYKFSTSKHKNIKKFGDAFAYVIKYGLVFPILIALWFLVLSMFLLLLTEEIALEQILMTSIVIVSAARMASYYKEDLASDLAKLIPFALLAILISNPNFFAVETTVSRLSSITDALPMIANFLIFSIVLEWSLRIIYLLKSGFDEIRGKK